ncbi:invasion associated locus B family protein [Niveispirillum sp.]|uniref:invasion associated locus B family protein n=1 Tax=Niveispirillum sp. TaxID=1917217 RepID=UPI001B565345|nr:invasion associated locus B family protein [Niveispirillum sp.]MBP7338655.1 invasion associated locus B family protein [Niveispirillum sp.]
MHASLRLAGASILIGSLLGGGARAEQTQADPVQPVETTATYQDWVVRCIKPKDKPRTCEIVQNLQMQGKGVVASIAVGRTDPKAPMIIVIQVPQGVWLPSGITFQIGDAGKALRLDYKRCVQVCGAETSLDPATLSRMKSATEAGSFAFDDGMRRPVKFPVSFKGFAAALDASLTP